MVERFSLPRYRCEFCSRTFETLHDAQEHEAVCRESRFKIPFFMGRWVEGDGIVGMATQTRNADSFIGVSTPFSTMVTWVSPLKIREIDAETARKRMNETLDAKIHAFELKADDYRRDAR